MNSTTLARNSVGIGFTFISLNHVVAHAVQYILARSSTRRSISKKSCIAYGLLQRLKLFHVLSMTAGLGFFKHNILYFIRWMKSLGYLEKLFYYDLGRKLIKALFQ